MALDEGTTLGQYRIEAKIGAGGMGEVYRARDMRLNRDVAIKVLPERLRDDPDRLARLRREARALASLNAPDIAVIHGLEEDDGVPYLVLELVRGDSLAEVLRNRSLSTREALRICLGVASGLEAAHARGVIHRDLKPANVMVTPRGVKLLDFGLARILAPKSEQVGSDAVTREPDLSGSGQVMGTISYMAPEQLRGEDVDERVDIWALGCLLFETLTGRRAFRGQTHSEVAAAVLAGEPDWNLLASQPEQLRRLVRRCLRPDPEVRLHAAADARVELQEILEEGGDPVRRTDGGLGEERGPARRAVRAWIVAVAVLVAALLALWLWPRGVGSEAGMTTRLEITLPAELGLSYETEVPPPLAVSPTGETVAIVADGEGRRRLFLRDLGDFGLRVVEGSEGARAPFFSPDGEWVAFFADGYLRKVPVGGGAAIRLAPADPGFAGAWSEDDTIVFVPSLVSPLWKVDAEGGQPEPFTSLRPDELESGHHAPTFLPGGRHVLFSVWDGGHQRNSRIAVQALDEPSHRILLSGGSHPRFVQPRYLVYSRGGTTLAVPFDRSRLEPGGTPLPVLEDVQPTPYIGSPLLAVSPSGTLAYVSHTVPEESGRLGFLDESGEWLPLFDRPGPYNRPRLSPDGRFVAFHSSGDDNDVWTFELRRGVLLRITDFPGLDGFPVWSPDSTRIVYASTREGPLNLYVRRANGAGDPERLLPAGNVRWPTSWSPDGKSILFTETGSETGSDLWILDLEEGGGPRALLAGPADEAWGRFSPDGDWVVFERIEASGDPEIVLVSAADTERQIRVSPRGGQRPIWSHDGNAIVYTTDEGLVSAHVSFEPELEVDVPRLLVPIEARYRFNDHGPDGDRFLGIESSPYPRLGTIKVILRWARELEARLEA